MYRFLERSCIARQNAPMILPCIVIFNETRFRASPAPHCRTASLDDGQLHHKQTKRILSTYTAALNCRQTLLLLSFSYSPLLCKNILYQRTSHARTRAPKYALHCRALNIAHKRLRSLQNLVICHDSWPTLYCDSRVVNGDQMQSFLSLSITSRLPLSMKYTQNKNRSVAGVKNAASLLSSFV